MSQPSITATPGQPKRFLKKGEGLKRFAAYKPPLPVSTNKAVRRQTFVKFKLESKSKNTNSIYPDLPSDDSINLSTEIPRIPPPKIMHTPIRPNRTALGPLATPNTNTPFITTPTLRGYGVEHERNFTRKVTFIQPSDEKRISFEGFRRPNTPSPHQSPVTQQLETQSSEEYVSPKSNEPMDVTTPPKRYNLRGSRKTACNTAMSTVAPTKVQSKKPRRQMRAVVERHITPPSESTEQQPVTESELEDNMSSLLRKIEERKASLEEDATSDTDLNTPLEDAVAEDHTTPININCLRVTPTFDLSTPSPGSCILALGQHIQRIEDTVNELKRKTENCTCGAGLAVVEQATSGRATRKTTRAKANRETRPSAETDKSTPRILNALVDEVAQLKSKFDEINIRR